MPTINQLIRHEGKPQGRMKQKGKINKVLLGSPQKSGTCLSVSVTSPKKPNSAKRKIAKVRLSTGKVITAYIIGQNHKLQTYAKVLVRGKGPADVPRCRFRLVAGWGDFQGVDTQRKSRSKYGRKKP